MNGRLAAVAFVGLLIGGPGCGSSTDAPAQVQERALYEGSFTVLESPSHGPELCAFVASSLPPQCGGLPLPNWDWEEVEGEESRNGTTWGEWHVIGTYRDGAFTLTEPPAAPRYPPERDHDFAPACDHPEVIDESAGAPEWDSATQDGEPLQIDDLVTIWVSHSGGASADFVVNVVVRPGAGGDATSAVRERYSGALCVVERDLPLEAQLETIQSEVMDEATSTAIGQVQSAGADPEQGAVVAEVWVVDDAAARYVRDRWNGRVMLSPLLHAVE